MLINCQLGGTYPRPKTSWREKHETFVSAVSASRQVDYALKTGTPLPPPPKTSLPKGKRYLSFFPFSFRYSQWHVICAPM
uniref:Uncharacterized protein n=1 Tax=Ascaris lumbricoides TaxID=6252 RepID=A0A0M3HJF7_ASCLU